MKASFEDRISLNWFGRLFDRDPSTPLRQIEPYISEGQVAADLGCASGYYTLALAERVGPKGRVYAVDLDGEVIRELEDKAKRNGRENIEFHATSAADLGFIADASVDFVLANGLLCVMPDHRDAAVGEIKRIMKPDGRAWIALGSPPPIGHVGGAEWEKILGGFRVEARGGFLQKWALVARLI